MRHFLLVLGILLILLGLVSTVCTITLMLTTPVEFSYMSFDGDTLRPTRTYYMPWSVAGEALFCAVLYGSGLAALYVRHKIRSC